MRKSVKSSLSALGFVTIAFVCFSSLFLAKRYPATEQLVNSSYLLKGVLENSDLLSIQQHFDNTRTHSVENETRKRRSLLIFGQDRSGTTFLSTMFSKDPQMFMVYEPLWITTRIRRMNDRLLNLSRVESGVTGAILGCKFSKSLAAKKFLSFANRPWTGAQPNNVFTSQPFCNKTREQHMYSRLVCRNLSQIPELVDKVCDAYKHSVVKVSPVRLPHEKMDNLIPQVLTENPDVDIRILHVIRDPRGNINSRIDINWMKDFPSPTLAEDAKQLCDKTYTNLFYVKTTLRRLGLEHRYKLILYQKIADDPIQAMHDVYDFAGFEKSAAVEKWINKTTHPTPEQLKKALIHPYSTVRNATGNADKWKKDEFFERNRIIEQQCEPLMKEFGFEKVRPPQNRENQS